MIDPIFTTSALASVESALNMALMMAPEIRAELATQKGKSLRLACLAPDIQIDIVMGDKVRIVHASQAQPNACIQGELRDWLALATAEDKASELINGGLKLTGDSKWLMQLGDTVSGLDIDWEGQLANLIGDVPAHLLGRGSSVARELLQPLAGILQDRLNTPGDSLQRDVQQGIQKAQAVVSDILAAGKNTGGPQPED